MKIVKYLLITVLAFFAILAAGVIFTGQHFCIGNSDVCFTSE